MDRFHASRPSRAVSGPAGPSCRLRRRSARATWPIVTALIVVALPAAVATPKGDDGKVDSDHSDREWVHREGSTLLVLEPPALAGVSRWAIGRLRDFRTEGGGCRCLVVKPGGPCR